jgi:hypothetical protein
VTGATAVERALAAAHLPLWLDATFALPWRGRPAQGAAAAGARALGAALLDGAGGAAALVAETTAQLPTLAMHNELRSPAVLLLVDEGGTGDGGRGACRDGLPLVQWEAGSTQECYELVRLAARLSLRSAMPVAVRFSRALLNSEGPVAETPADPPPPPARYLRATGPHRTVGSARAWHYAKRARRIAAATPLVEQLCQQQGHDAGGTRAVIAAGHVLPTVAAAASSRRLPVLRLAAAWPLPETRIADFLRHRDDVLVLESGAPSLWRGVAAIAGASGLGCRVLPSDGDLNDLDHVEAVLSRFAGRRRAETSWTPRPPETWRAAQAGAASVDEDSEEPWPLYFARARAATRVEAAAAMRLLDALRQASRPAIVVGEPGTPLTAEVGERLFDVEVTAGFAVDVADAMAQALTAPGIAPVLCVAVYGETGLGAGDLLGAASAARSHADVLQIFVARNTDGVEAQLRAAGLQVTLTSLDDPNLAAAVTATASRGGPRALVCQAGAAG